MKTFTVITFKSQLKKSSLKSDYSFIQNAKLGEEKN